MNKNIQEKICRTQLQHIEELNKLIHRQMLKQCILQNQMVWVRSLLTISILITGTADVSNEPKPLWLLYSSYMQYNIALPF